MTVVLPMEVVARDDEKLSSETTCLFVDLVSA